MKISSSEIKAVIDASPRIYPAEAAKILEAAYIVRKRRKTAKRERQRKEKAKQVVESVIPTYPQLQEALNVAASMGRYGSDGLGGPTHFTPSKAPEWDGNASAFDAAMKPKGEQ